MHASTGSEILHTKPQREIGGTYIRVYIGGIRSITNKERVVAIDCGEKTAERSLYCGISYSRSCSFRERRHGFHNVYAHAWKLRERPSPLKKKSNP